MRRTLATTLAILAATGLTPAAAEPRATGQLRPWGSPLRAWGPLGVVWHETEGDWQGTWTPVGSGGVFRAEWRLNRQVERADLQISIESQAVTVVRTQANGQCTYHGNLLPGRTPRETRVAGVYRCDWSPRSLRWSAVIGG